MSTAANSNSTGQPTADSKAALPDGVGVIQTSEGPGTCSARTLRPRGRPTLDLGKLKGNAKLRGRARQRYERERDPPAALRRAAPTPVTRSLLGQKRPPTAAGRCWAGTMGTRFGRWSPGNGAHNQAQAGRSTECAQRKNCIC